MDKTITLSKHETVIDKLDLEELQEEASKKIYVLTIGKISNKGNIIDPVTKFVKSKEEKSKILLHYQKQYSPFHVQIDEVSDIDHKEPEVKEKAIQKPISIRLPLTKEEIEKTVNLLKEKRNSDKNLTEHEQDMMRKYLDPIQTTLLDKKVISSERYGTMTVKGMPQYINI